MNSKKNTELTFELEVLGSLEHSSLAELTSTTDFLLLYLQNPAPLVQEGALLGLTVLIDSTASIEDRQPVLAKISAAAQSLQQTTSSPSIKIVIGDLLKTLQQQ